MLEDEHKLELQQKEKSILEAIKSLRLELMTREQLEHTVARLTLELDNAKDELAVTDKLLKSILSNTFSTFSKPKKGLAAIIQKRALLHLRKDNGKRRHSKTEVGKAKFLIFQEWLKWQVDNSMFESNSDFGKEMSDIHQISEARKISEWSIEWSKGKNLPPAAEGL